MSDRVTFGRLALLTARGLGLRCPRCGGGSIVRSWWSLKPACPRCAFLLDRGERDFWIGGYAVNIVAAELLVTLVLGVIVVVRWPDVPWTFLQYGGAVLAVLVPVLFFPFSRTLWLAWDYCFRPVRD